jgi:hypothetical protein
MTVDVRVWLGAWRRPDAWTGHSSLSIEPALYISYWPGRSESRAYPRKKKSVFRERPQGWSDSIDADITKLGRPSHIVRIDNLNEKSIEKFWSDIKAGNGKFNLLEHNCSTVVANALQTGYTEAMESGRFGTIAKQVRWLAPSNYLAFALASFSNESIWYPSQVLRLARSLARVMDDW